MRKPNVDMTDESRVRVPLLDGRVVEGLQSGASEFVVPDSLKSGQLRHRSFRATGTIDDDGLPLFVEER